MFYLILGISWMKKQVLTLTLLLTHDSVAQRQHPEEFMHGWFPHHHCLQQGLVIKTEATVG